MAISLVGLGANLGDKAETLDEAVRRFSAVPGFKLLAKSPWIATAPVGGPPGQGDFLNGAVLLESSLDPRRILTELQGIEQALGRARDVHWGPRSIDLDLLLVDDTVVAELGLEIPHPWLPIRRFVLEPAAEIAPDLRHPLIGWTLRQLFDHLRTARPYFALVGPPGIGKTELALALAARFSGRAIVDTVSTGPKPSDEIKSLESRADLLSVANWQESDGPWFSDFWLEQSLSQGQEVSELREVSRVLSGVKSRIVPPKLKIILEDGPLRDRKWPTDLATRAGQGPWLRVSAADRGAALETIAAAVEAMH